MRVTLRARQHLDDAIGIGAEELVPLVLLSDAGSFAQAVGREVSLLVTGPDSKLLIQAEYPERHEALSRIADAAFRTHIHPLRLWKGQLPWVALVADLQEPGANDSLPGLIRELATSSFVIPFIMGDLSVSDWAELVKRLGDLSGPVFLIAPQGAVKRDEDMLAKGIAAYVFASWSAYARNKDGLWRQALALTGEGRIFSLGMAFDQPDWRFHGFTWQAEALQELARLWSMQGGSADRPDYPSALEMAQDVAPSSNYIARDERDNDVGALLMGQKAISYSFVQSPVIPEFRSARSGENLPLRIQRLRKFREFLFLSERQAVDRLVVRHTRRWQQVLRAKLVRSLILPQSPLGCLRWVRSLLEHWGRYLDTLAGMRLRPAGHVRSFEDNLARLASREARRPVLSGVLLRYLLIVVGSAWTVWGTFFWATRGQPWNDPGMSRILLLTVGGLVVLLALVVGQFGLLQAACVRAELLTRSDLLAEFLAGVVARIRQLLLRRVEVLQKELVHWNDTLEKLLAWAEDLAAGRGLGAPARPGNGNPRFEPGSLATLQAERQTMAVDRVHRALSAKLMEDSRWPLFEATVWGEHVHELMRREVEEQIAQIRYDECVAAARWTDSTCQYLAKDLVHDARRPAFAVNLVEHAAVVLLASRQWEQHVAGDALVRVTGHRLPYVCAVSAVPLAGVEMAREGL